LLIYLSSAIEVEDSIAYNPTLSPFSKVVFVTRVLVLLIFVENVIGVVPGEVSESNLLTQEEIGRKREHNKTEINLLLLIVVLLICCYFMKYNCCISS
jgi:hypothetical protein